MTSTSAFPKPSIQCAAASIVTYVTEETVTSPKWTPGPQPFAVLNEGQATTDRSWRERHVDERIHAALYDHRQHLTLTGAVSLEGTIGHGELVSVVGVEFLPTQNIYAQEQAGCAASDDAACQRGIAIVHLESNIENFRLFAQMLKELARPNYGHAPKVAAILKDVAGLTYSLSSTVYLNSFYCLDAASTTALASFQETGPFDAQRLRLHQRLTWLLARGTAREISKLSSQIIPAETAIFDDAPDRILVVDREGLSMSLSRPRINTEEITREFSNFIAPFRSVYADTLMLFALQRSQLINLASGVVKLEDPVSDTPQMNIYLNRWRSVRNCTWWKSVSHWAWPDRALMGLHRLNSMEESYNQLADDFDFFTAAMERRSAAELDAVNRNVARLTIILGFLAVPLGFLGAIAAVLPVINVSLTVSRTVIAVCAGLVLLSIPVGLHFYRRLPALRAALHEGSSQ